MFTKHIQNSFSRVKRFCCENLTRAVLVDDENVVGVFVDAVLLNGNVVFRIAEVVVDDDAIVVVVAIVVVFFIVEVFPIVVVSVIIGVVFAFVDTVAALHSTSA